ncbi:MAG: tRNA (guanine-N(1)-)-methyltransferase [bacterium ADurb.Bin212]|nr:MAG: tRNA (guanine-N(1)-)-methyltransferase [bacterium ADurb.Bin212]
MLRFDIITLFPNMFDGPFSESIIKRAKNKGLIEINLHQLRDYATDKHKTVDDTPCGGGPGMVIKVDVVDKAIGDIIKQSHMAKDETRTCEISTVASAFEAEGKKKAPRNFASQAKQKKATTKSKIIMLSASGKKFTQQKAIELSKYENIILLCGHYEGFDQRIHDHLVDEEISIGDYVLTGGEIPAMVLVDTISRMIPGVIKEESIMNESFMNLSPETCRLKPDYDYPVYTRPIEYKGWRVPEVLLSGDHKAIEGWRNNPNTK